MTEPRLTQHPADFARQTQVVSLDDEAIVDVDAAANFLGYVTRSCRRQKRRLRRTALCTFLAIVALAFILPRSYRIDTRILTKKTSVMNALVNPDRSVPPSADAPTAGAVELINSRENIDGLITDADLIKRTQETRSVLARAKDRAFALLGPRDEEAIREGYITTVGEKISASVDGDVIVMSVEWSDAEIAMALTEQLVARFLKMRRDMELGEIEKAVTILGHNVEMSRTSIEAVVKRMQKVFEDRETEMQVRKGVPRSEAKRAHKARFISIRKPVAVSAPDAGVTSRKRELEEKNSAASIMRRAYVDRVNRAEAELATLQASLGPDHPDVVKAKRDLDALTKQPPELMEVDADRTRLAGELQVPVPAATVAPAAAVLPLEAADKDITEEQKFDVMRVPVSEDLYKEMDKDPEIAAVLDELKKRQDNHDTLFRRLASARIERETADAAFDRRYHLTKEPILPKKAIKPNVVGMIGGGAVAALLLGVLVALLTDLLSGLLLEGWQVQRFLGVKLLGEVEEL